MYDWYALVVLKDGTSFSECHHQYRLVKKEKKASGVFSLLCYRTHSLMSNMFASMNRNTQLFDCMVTIFISDATNSCY